MDVYYLKVLRLILIVLFMPIHAKYLHASAKNATTLDFTHTPATDPTAPSADFGAQHETPLFCRSGD
jgi:hypothetical protein